MPMVNSLESTVSRCRVLHLAIPPSWGSPFGQPFRPVILRPRLSTGLPHSGRTKTFFHERYIGHVRKDFNETLARKSGSPYPVTPRPLLFPPLSGTFVTYTLQTQ